ncbi:MAG: hypothetical protein K2M65_07555, partial [Muribaculaceae bacterium]|nr:hypothetical protein [Muribaculaceae bacterium]
MVQWSVVDVLENARRAGRPLCGLILRCMAVSGDTILRLYHIWQKSQGSKCVTIDSDFTEIPIYDDYEIDDITPVCELTWNPGEASRFWWDRTEADSSTAVIKQKIG